MTAKQTKPLSLREAGVLLVKHYDLHEGLWAIAFGINIGVGQFGPSPQEALPGAMIGIGNVFLMSSEKDGPNVVNAVEVNPAKKAIAKKAPSKK
jgi:hypothetical protein